MPQDTDSPIRVVGGPHNPLPIRMFHRRNDDNEDHLHEHERGTANLSLSSSLPNAQKECTFDQCCPVGSATHVPPIAYRSHKEAG